MIVKGYKNIERESERERERESSLGDIITINILTLTIRRNGARSFIIVNTETSQYFVHFGLLASFQQSSQNGRRKKSKRA